LILPYIFVCTGVALAFILLSRYSYAWLFLGLTNIMVLAFAIEQPAQLHAIARLRVADVAIGTVASLIVATLIAPRAVPWRQTLRSISAAPKPGFATSLTPDARFRLVRHVSEAALGVTLVTALGYWFRLPNFTQAAITVLVVMIVPYADFEADRYRAVGRRLVLRGAGCLAGGLLGLLLLLITEFVPPLWWAALPVGIWIGEHLQTGDRRIGYFGTQFAFAFIVGFVQDVGGPRPGGDWGGYPAFQRLAGVLTGVAILAVIFGTSQLISARLQRR